jgi:MFS family permease
VSSASFASSKILLTHLPFQCYLWARGFSSFSYQIATVAVGWQIYAIPNSAFALGVVGLVQFLPTALLVFVAGHAADRYDRKRVLQVCQMVEGLTAAFLAYGNFAGWLNAPEIFAAIALIGTAKAFENPAAAVLLPGVTPEGMFQEGTALSSAAFQLAVISGPALGVWLTPWRPAYLTR